MIYNDSVGGAKAWQFAKSPSTGVADFGLDNALCQRALVTGTDPVSGTALTAASMPTKVQSDAVRAGIAEVVLNGNSLESAMSQYTSMVLEKSLVDRGAAGGEIPNILCSSPFVRSPLAWGLAPSHVVPGVDGGVLTRSVGQG